VDHLSPSQRGVAIVFQNYALFPHMTVAQNVAYGLQARKWSRAKIAPRRTIQSVDLHSIDPLRDAAVTSLILALVPFTAITNAHRR
jgi:ABC-type Fe3+/spermidine/putrescine transport system ATPase subunit